MTDQTADLNRQFLTTLANLGIASHRLGQIRDAARLHRQQLIGTSELYAVIEATDPPAESAGRAPAADQAALERVVRRIGQMADHWEQHLPEVIRTPAVVSAIRAALEPADAVLAVLPEAAADQAAALTAAERTMLVYALDLAQEQIYSRGNEFTADDQAAVDRLRRMAGEAPHTGEA